MPHRNVIKAQATLAGLTLTDLAAQVGVSKATLYEVAAGRRQAWPKLRVDLCDALGVPASRLFPAPRATDPVS